MACNWRCANGLQGLGNLLLDLGRFEEVDRAYALADPGQTNARIQFNRSRVMQGLGRWRESWSLAESRWMDGGEALEGSPPRPHWSGWPDVDRLVLWDEQGFGDTLQALRWLPRLMQQGCQVELQVRPALQRLLQQGLAWLGPRLRVSERPRATSEPAQTMCHGSLLSLPARLNVDGIRLVAFCACRSNRRHPQRDQDWLGLGGRALPR